MEIEFDVPGMEPFTIHHAKEVRIMGVENGVRKQIGHIITPSSSSQNIKNAIQICGFSEAFDLWGCASFCHKEKPEIDRIHKEIMEELQEKRLNWMQAKDIQLKFEFDSKQGNNSNVGRAHCMACYNIPCNCENKGSHLEVCPFNVKRESQVGNLEFVNPLLNELKKELNLEED